MTVPSDDSLIDPYEAGLDGFPIASSAGKTARRQPSLDALMDQFVSEARRGLMPSVDDYADRYPQYGDEIRDVFPALIALEQWKLDKEVECLRRNLPAELTVRQLGDCRLLYEIGRGGMGVVFEATQGPSQKRVAVKLLPWRYGASVPKWRLRFEAETRTLSKLNHPNIIPVLGFGEQDDYFYYIMPRVDGISVDRIVRRLEEEGIVDVGEELAQERQRVLQGGEQLPGAQGTATPDDQSPGKDEVRPGTFRRNSWKQFATVMYQAARAVAFAHAQNVLHNDIKPANILVDTAERVLVGDFGLARHIDSEESERAEGLSGTLRYMAPERFTGRCDELSDVYSLGATLYELATQRPAFIEPDRRLLIEKIAASDFPQPRSINADIPTALERIILTAMENDPDERYASAEALAADLLRFSNGRRVEAPGHGRLRRLWRSLGRVFQRKSRPDVPAGR